MQFGDLLDGQALSETAHEALVPQSIGNHLRHTGALANGLPGACKFASFPRTAFRLLPGDTSRLLFMDPSLEKRCIAWPRGDCWQKHLNHIVAHWTGSEPLLPPRPL